MYTNSEGLHFGSVCGIWRAVAQENGMYQIGSYRSVRDFLDLLKTNEGMSKGVKHLDTTAVFDGNQEDLISILQLATNFECLRLEMCGDPMSDQLAAAVAGSTRVK